MPDHLLESTLFNFKHWELFYIISARFSPFISERLIDENHDHEKYPRQDNAKDPYCILGRVRIMNNHVPGGMQELNNHIPGSMDIMNN